jgi:hypothetical protein
MDLVMGSLLGSSALGLLPGSSATGLQPGTAKLVLLFPELMGTPAMGRHQLRSGGRRCAGRLDGGRQSTSDASSTRLVWPDGVSGLTGDGSGSFSPPYSVMEPTAAGEGAESSLVVSAATVPFGVGPGDESGSCSSGSIDLGRDFAGDGSVSTATSDGSAFLHHREVWTVYISGDRPESAIPTGSPRLLDSKHLAFGLAKSQIWLLGWIEDRLKINEELKDEDHSVFLKAMVEDFVGLT